MDPNLNGPGKSRMNKSFISSPPTRVQDTQSLFGGSSVPEQYHQQEQQKKMNSLHKRVNYGAYLSEPMFREQQEQEQENVRVHSDIDSSGWSIKNPSMVHTQNYHNPPHFMERHERSSSGEEINLFSNNPYHHPIPDQNSGINFEQFYGSNSYNKEDLNFGQSDQEFLHSGERKRSSKFSNPSHYGGGDSDNTDLDACVVSEANTSGIMVEPQKKTRKRSRKPAEVDSSGWLPENPSFDTPEWNYGFNDYSMKPDHQSGEFLNYGDGKQSSSREEINLFSDNPSHYQIPDQNSGINFGQFYGSNSYNNKYLNFEQSDHEFLHSGDNKRSSHYGGGDSDHTDLDAYVVSEANSSGIMVEPEKKTQKRDRKPAEGREEPLSHVEAQKRYRDKITQKLYELQAAVPLVTKMDKASIIDNAIAHIKALEEELKTSQSEIKSLQSQNENLKKEIADKKSH